MMANNRLWLVHRPTGAAVCLGKRMAHGWYMNRSDIDERIMEFWEECWTDTLEDQDDFALVLEDAEHAPAATDKFAYGERDGKIVPVLGQP